jgi:hypothetical protein
MADECHGVGIPLTQVSALARPWWTARDALVPLPEAEAGASERARRSTFNCVNLSQGDIRLSWNRAILLSSIRSGSLAGAGGLAVRTEIVAFCAVALLASAEAQPYTIFTYAGGTPLPPSVAVTLAADRSGNIYFADPIGSNSVFKADAAGAITRVAGNSRTAFSGDGGPAIDASLNSPRSVTVDPAGNLYILDAGNQRVRRVTPDGIITTFAGGGSAVLGDGGPAVSGQLNYPESIVADASGNLFIGELNRVRRVGPDGVITTIAGGGVNDPLDGVPATSARLTYVPSLGVDGAGNLFIGNEIFDGPEDAFTYSILKMSPNGILATVPPVAGFAGVLGGASYPYHAEMSVDNAGNLFLPLGAQLWKISPGGAATLVAGTGVFGISGDGGPASRAQLNVPAAVGSDVSGNLYIADSNGRSIRKISPDGIIHLLATIGDPRGILPLPPSGDGGPATSAQLSVVFAARSTSGNEGGLATDRACNLYIAETWAGRVRKVSPEGIISTVAGVGGPYCPAPGACLALGDGGPATSAGLNFPTGLAVDFKGNLFIAETAGSRVRKVSPDGMITTVAGTGAGPRQPGDGDGGLAVNAPVSAWGVAVDDAGNLFISGGNYADVRKVSVDGIISTITSGYGFIFSVAVDHSGHLFVAREACDDGDVACWTQVDRFSPDGTSTTLAGCSTCYVYTEGGSAIDAYLDPFAAMAVTAAGDLLVSDSSRGQVRKIDANGIITTIAGNGSNGYSGDGGPAAAASLSFVSGLAADSAGNIYVTDALNQAVRVLRAAGR